MNREHKIRLAVINTAHYRFPWQFSQFGMVSAIKKLTDEPLCLKEGGLIHEWVLKEWSKLS